MATESATKRAYAELKRRILTNEVPAGTQFMETELASSLGVSRTPAREAAIRLAEEGLVEIRPRHGIRIRPISAEDMREIYEILTELEALAARRAAEQRLEEPALEPLEAATAEMARALERDDLQAWAEADQRFHDLLVEAGGNRRLVGAVRVYRDQAHRARMLTLRLRPRPSGSTEDHRTLVEAIRGGQAERAEAIHRRHRAEAGRTLVTLLESLGLTRM